MLGPQLPLESAFVPQLPPALPHILGSANSIFATLHAQGTETIGVYQACAAYETRRDKAKT
jgi:hypothetical protein